jgi:agmatine deiminase
VTQPDAITWSAEEAAEVDAVDGIAQRVAGERIAATYVNYYIGNMSVFVPTYEDRNDAAGLATIQACFPNHRVVGVPGCRDILLIGGSIGCITQPQYAGGQRRSRK